MDDYNIIPIQHVKDGHKSINVLTSSNFLDGFGDKHEPGIKTETIYASPRGVQDYQGVIREVVN